MQLLRLFRATLTPLSYSPNFPRAQYLDIRMMTHELIVKYKTKIYPNEINNGKISINEIHMKI